MSIFKAEIAKDNAEFREELSVLKKEQEEFSKQANTISTSCVTIELLKEQLVQMQLEHAQQIAALTKKIHSLEVKNGKLHECLFAVDNAFNSESNKLKRAQKFLSDYKRNNSIT